MIVCTYKEGTHVPKKNQMFGLTKKL